MGEAIPPRNRGQDVPTRSGETMGEREPLAPQPESDRKEDRPLPEKETYERGREERRPNEKRPPVED
jgi:hypothetical protein